MKPVYLEFCGIKSFSSPAKIDFRKLLRSGIFGIFGDTGAGKSTVLDSLSFALYGRVNRVGNGRDGTSVSEIINYNSDKATVTFDFESEWQGERHLYRVERTLPKKGAPKAMLYRQNEEKWETIAATPSSVTEEIEKNILGIGFEDFKKCIALPQGEFSQFLQASRGDRLKLVAKLFSLEEYGNALAQKINGRLSEKNGQKQQAEGELSAYADVTDEGIAERKKKQEEAEKAYDLLDGEVKKEETALSEYGEKLKRKKLLAEAEKRFADLSVREERMTEKKSALSKLQKAKTACSQAADWRDAENSFQKSVKEIDRLEKEKAELSLKIERKKAEILAENTEQELELLTGQIALAKQAEAEEKKLATLQKSLNDCRKEYETLFAQGKEFVSFDYEKERSGLQAQLSALPTENDPLTFIGGRAKEALLREEYACFVAELEALTEKYPQIGADTQALIGKYTLPGEVQRVNLVALTETFRAAMEEKEKLNGKLHALDLKREKCDRVRSELNRLTEEGRKRRAEYDEQKSALEQLLRAGNLEELNRRQRLLKEKKEKSRSELEGLQAQENRCASNLSGEQARKDEFYSRSTKLAKALRETLDEGGMSEVKEAETLLTRLGDPDSVQRETERYFQELAAARAERERLKKEVGDAGLYSEDVYREMQEVLKGHRAQLLGYSNSIAVSGKEIADMTEKLVRKKEICERLRRLSEQTGLLEKLKNLVAKDKFMDYVAVEYLQEIAMYANNLLMRLTNGRYFLVYGEKNFEVGDNFNEGRTRGAQTLSGGEIFLVSLSLALSLSRAIQQNSLRPIEFFFLDEGFGTLDDGLVDTVMDSLEKLKREDFSIGIISHVGELKNRLESKIFVTKASEEKGSSLQMY